MAPKREITVSNHTPMPAGYVFLPKGSQYKTLNCRRLTQEAGKTVYVVEDKKKTIGIRIPKHVFFKVQASARETLSTRRAATERRDATAVRQADTELTRLFPKIPVQEKDAVLKRAFRKHSGRVGRTGKIGLGRKVQLAVIAYIRHKHTEYDKLLQRGVERKDARDMVKGRMQELLVSWGVRKGDLDWYVGLSGK